MIKHQNLRPENVKILVKEYQAQLVVGPACQHFKVKGDLPYMTMPDPEISYLGFSGFNNLAKSIAKLSKRHYHS